LEGGGAGSQCKIDTLTAEGAATQHILGLILYVVSHARATQMCGNSLHDY
jgi:hypothetical protein